MLVIYVSNLMLSWNSMCVYYAAIFTPIKLLKKLLQNIVLLALYCDTYHITPLN